MDTPKIVVAVYCKQDFANGTFKSGDMYTCESFTDDTEAKAFYDRWEQNSYMFKSEIYQKVE